MRDKRVSHLRGLADLGWLAVIVAGLLFLVHAKLFEGWTVDDAGISFAYARSLAGGHGLVSQPGAPPVEGYSNFLWVVLLAPFFYFGTFDPFVTPRVISYVLVMGSFIAVRLIFRSFGDRRGVVTLFALSLAALNTSFAYWTTAGLENPLYVFLLSLLLWRCMVNLGRLRTGGWEAAGIGLLAAAVAMTRPEGAVYFFAFPLALLLRRLDRRVESPPSARRALLAYAGGVVLIYGGFILFRVLYFGDLLPNPYYAKIDFRPHESPALAGPGPPLWMRVANLIRSVSGGQWIALTVLLVGATLYLIVRRRMRRELVMLLGFLGLVAAGYLALPDDWMREFRYGTAFFLFFYVFLAGLISEVVVSVKLGRRVRALVVTALLAGTLVGSFFVFANRSLELQRDPVCPFIEIASHYACRFNCYAETLDIEKGTLMLPDIGASLVYSDLRLYDLGMLCDRTMARTIRRDQAAFYDYVFEEVKPTFIHTHGSWSYRAELHKDPRLERDYAAIARWEEAWPPETGEYHTVSGDFVRRDAVEGREEALAKARAMPHHEWYGSAGHARFRAGQSSGRPHRGAAPLRGDWIPPRAG